MSYVERTKDLFHIIQTISDRKHRCFY